ncbi:short-chain dehydrogenase/reductase [Leptospira kobayashii]|uniref:Short-chain dehydrogenase/reductase n=1 Tax=Leptospira kobayashii TaxID=1917830 RepID=A0ABM7UQG8_9LEPT|nr:SDR family NAD(P)-dependent oxidoreductase [Leptospira kobayashii]BDA77429.1 short-chain dehydrogenase/reductase [Leptospira kobayashii]
MNQDSLKRSKVAQDTVVVTGAGSGIGYAISERLVSDGYKVYGTAIHKEEADRLQKEFGASFFPIIVDIREEKTIQAAIATITHRNGEEPVEAVINVAGIVQNGPLCDVSSDEFKNILSVNVVGMHNISRAFLPFLMRAKSPRIINISSTGGQRTLPFNGAYSASKFAVEALSSAMRMEYHCLGIKVVVVAPSMVKTPMTNKIQEDLKKDPSLTIYKKPMLRFLKRAEQVFQNGPSVQLVVDQVIHALTKKNPKDRYVIYQSWWRDYLLMKILPVRKREEIFRKVIGL